MRIRRWCALVAAALCVSAVTAGAAAAQAPPISGSPGSYVAPATGTTSTATVIPVSGTAPGRTFDGIGAISGGGGNSRYLIDYPQAARDAILDHLFTPDYGASLQMLKVEIGGDANSTSGSEASVEQSRGVIDCDAGYEFWLMEQAKARNPALKLYALAWTAPGWTGTFWSKDNIAYVIDWLRCARSHGLTIDYLGGTQNEMGYDKTWSEALRAALDASGFKTTQIVMADNGNWSVAADLAGDSAFRAATDIVGVHDPCGYPTTADQCTSTPAAQQLGKPLWASEVGAMDGVTGAPAMARAMIRGYPNARLVAYIHWPLISAIPPFVPHRDQGLIYARQPWSGNYQVNAMAYAIAMMTWFTAPGWQYVDGAGGGFGVTAAPYANGSYVTLKSPDGADWSTVAETTTTTADQDATFQISGGLPAETVHVWRTDPGSTDPADWMVALDDVHPAGGTFSYALEPGYIYTFTTLQRSPKGSAPVPAPAGLERYVEQPDANPLDDAPRYLAAMDGTFRYVPCATDTSRLCTQQMTPQPPIYWGAHAGFPHAVIGDESLQTDYTVAADVLFTQHGSSAGVIDRYSSYTGAISSFRGYIFALDDGGAWQLLRNSRAVGVSVMGHGTLAVPPGVGTWHRLALTVKGSTQSGSIDGRQVVSASDTDPNYVTGIAGVEAGATLNSAQNAWTGTSWPIVQFRDLTVLPPARGTGHPTQVSGDVTPALALGVGAHSSFGAFTPGVAKDYQASVDATVTATARDAALTVVDPSATNPGHLRNGAFVMPRALQVAAASPAAGTHEYVAVGGSPAPLLGYSGPIAADPVTITFKQPMSATDALASGTYGTTLTFSLSTTTP